jgi:hypothetical protein
MPTWMPEHITVTFSAATIRAGLALAAALLLAGLAPDTTAAGSQPNEGADHAPVAPIPIPLPSAVGSSAPNLSKGADGTIVLSWLEPGEPQTQLKFSRLTPAGWDEPRIAARGSDWFVNWADFPSVVPISGNFWVAHWLQRVPGGKYAYHVNMSVSQDSGASWSEPIRPHRDTSPTEHGFASLFPWQGGAGVIWLDGRNSALGEAQPDNGHDVHPEHDRRGMTLRSAVILPDGGITAESEMDGLVCDCCQTGVALPSNGPVAVYRNRTEGEIRDIYLSRNIAGQWQEGRPVHHDGWKISGCPVNGPAIAAAGDTVVVAWFTMAGDMPRVQFARSDDGGSTFPQVLKLAEQSPQGRVDVVLLDDGSSAVSWLDEVPGDAGQAASSLIRIQLIRADGTLAGRHILRGLESGRTSGFPRMVADGQSLVLAWTDTRDKATRVVSSRIPLAGPARPASD